MSPIDDDECDRLADQFFPGHGTEARVKLRALIRDACRMENMACEEAARHKRIDIMLCSGFADEKAAACFDDGVIVGRNAAALAISARWPNETK